VKSGGVAQVFKDYLNEIKLVRGQFFQVFKMISKDLNAVKCPKECK